MLSIRLLGGFKVAQTDGDNLDRLGPKPRALLAYLAMSRGKAVSRGQLADLLWGERDEEHARHSLSQALTTIRAALGPAAAVVLHSSSDGVGLAHDKLELDVDAFERATCSKEQEKLRDLCDLYQGEFLQGMEISEPGFEDWLLGERYRLGELAAEAFSRLLDLQIAEADGEAAIETARRLISVAPLDESAYARLISLYGSLGRSELAEAHYERCAFLLRRELDQVPGEELKVAIAEARRRSPGRTISVSPRPSRPNQEIRKTKVRWGPIAAAGAILLLLVGLWTLYGSWNGDSGNHKEALLTLPAEPSIVVLPFENISSDPERSFFADGLTNDIITDLSKFSSLFVIASDSSFRYRDGQVTVKAVARDLGVRYVLKGSVQSLGGRLSIDVKLIEAKTGRHIWAERYERRAENLFAVQKEITRTIAAVVGSEGGELWHAETERIRRIPTKDLQAYGLYVRGVESRRQETKEGNALAIEMFEKAIQEDPNYARAMAECSVSYIYDVFQGWTDSPAKWLQRAEELARRAIKIDSSEPWGFVALGVVYQTKGRNEEAISLFETGYGLNPNDYGVNAALGYALTFSGSAERAVGLLERARRLNPYNTEEPTALVWAYFFSHRYQDALLTINEITRRHTHSYWIYKAAIHAQLDQMKEARAAIAEVLKLDPESTVQGQHERRLALGLAPKNAAHLSDALRKAGLPE